MNSFTYYEQFKLAIQHRTEAEEQAKIFLYMARIKENIPIQTLAKEAHIHRNTARTWIQDAQELLTKKPKPDFHTIDLTEVPENLKTQLKPYLLPQDSPPR